jgi:hypothetical protein
MSALEVHPARRSRYTAFEFAGIKKIDTPRSKDEEAITI